MKIVFKNSLMVFLIILICPFIILGCGSNDSEKAVVPIKQKQLLVLVYDISQSVDSYAILSPSSLENIYSSIGSKGGGKFYGVFIKTNSAKQEPITDSVSALELLEMKGNAYQRTNRERRNETLLAKFEAGKEQFMTSTRKLLVPKKEPFSDVRNALELARQIIEIPDYASWNKHLLIISDLENDLPPVNGLDKMQPVIFKGDTHIGIVRPSKEISVSEIMPGVQYTVYSTIDDAIQSMFNYPK